MAKLRAEAPHKVEYVPVMEEGPFVVKLPVDWKPVSVQVPGIPVVAEQSDPTVGAGIVDVPVNWPFEFRTEGVMPLYVTLPASVEVPVTMFSSSLVVMLKAPDAGVEPRAPAMVPTRVVPAQRMVPWVYVAAMTTE